MIHGAQIVEAQGFEAWIRGKGARGCKECGKSTFGSTHMISTWAWLASFKRSPKPKDSEGAAQSGTNKIRLGTNVPKSCANEGAYRDHAIPNQVVRAVSASAKVCGRLRYD